MACFTLTDHGPDHVAGDRSCPACDGGYPKTAPCCKFGLMHRERAPGKCDYCGKGEKVPEPKAVDIAVHLVIEPEPEPEKAAPAISPEEEPPASVPETEAVTPAPKPEQPATPKKKAAPKKRKKAAKKATKKADKKTKGKSDV